MGGACTTEFCSTGLSAGSRGDHTVYDIEKRAPSVRRSSSIEQDIRVDTVDFEDEIKMEWIMQAQFPDSSPSDADDSPLTHRSSKLSSPLATKCGPPSDHDLSHAELLVQFKTLTLLSRSRPSSAEEPSRSRRGYSADVVLPPTVASNSMFIESCYIVESESTPLLSPYASRALDRECSEERSSQAVDPDTIEFDEVRRVKLRTRQVRSTDTVISQVAGYLALEVKRETDLLHNSSVCIGYIPLSWCIDTYLTKGKRKKSMSMGASLAAAGASSSASSGGSSPSMTTPTSKRRSSKKRRSVKDKVRYKKGEFIVKMYSVPTDLSSSPKAPEQLELTEQKSSTPIGTGESWFDEGVGFPRRPTISIFEAPDTSGIPKPSRHSLVKFDRDGIARLLDDQSHSDDENLAAVLICSAHLEWNHPSPLSLSPVDPYKKGVPRMPMLAGPEKKIAQLIRDKPAILKLALFGTVFAKSTAAPPLSASSSGDSSTLMSQMNEYDLQRFLIRMSKEEITASMVTVDDVEGTPPPSSSFLASPTKSSTADPISDGIKNWSVKAEYRFGSVKESRRTLKKYHSENGYYLYIGKVFEFKIEKHILSLFTESCDTSPESCASTSTPRDSVSNGDRNAELLFDEESNHIGKSGAIMIRIRDKSGDTVACSALSVRDLLNRARVVSKDDDVMDEDALLLSPDRKKHKSSRSRRKKRESKTKRKKRDSSEIAVCKMQSVSMFEYTQYQSSGPSMMKKLPVIFDSSTSTMQLLNASTAVLMDGRDTTNPMLTDSDAGPSFTNAALLDRLPSKGRMFYKCVFVWP